MTIKEDNLIGYLLRLIKTNPELAIAKTRDSKGAPLPTRSSFLKLRKYTEDFLSDRTDQRIIIMPGLRGIGKTTLLFQVFNWLLNFKKIPKERVIYLTLDYLNEKMGSDLSEIIEIYEKTFLKEPIENLKEPLFLFLDEAHYDPKWQIIVKNLYDRSNKLLIFVSGSSALALGASADLVRRSVIDKILPLTFQEYLYLKKGFLPPNKTAEKIRIALNSDLNEAGYILSDTYQRLQSSFSKSSLNMSKEIEEFIISGGFPGSLKSENYVDTFRWLENVMGKIVTKDIPTFSPLSPKESQNLFAILHFLAENLPPGPQSAAHLAQITSNISETTAYNMMKALEKSCIVIPLQPKSSNSAKLTKKSLKYYFSSSSLRASLLWSIGKFKEFDSKIKGVLLEDAILAVIYKNIEKQTLVQGVSYDYEDEGADFIIKMPSGNVVVEVGWGEKGSKQLIKTMERVKSKFGVLICECNQVTINDKIIKVPRELILLS